MTGTERTAMYEEYLRDEGYRPIVTDSGDVAFKVEGLGYLILVDDEEIFFHLVFPNFWSIDSEEERDQVILASSRATATIKVAKVFPVEDDTWAAVEMFCSPPEVFKEVFPRAFSALKAAVECFREEVRSC